MRKRIHKIPNVRLDLFLQNLEQQQKKQRLQEVKDLTQQVITQKPSPKLRLQK